MAAETEPKDTTSFFRKVVKFVANPATDWADLDAPGRPTARASYAKHELKAMIERKRRNDFVRKREFDMLRKMRRSEVMAGQDPAARPSFFQSSMPSKPRRPRRRSSRRSTRSRPDVHAVVEDQAWRASSRSGSAPVLRCPRTCRRAPAAGRPPRASTAYIKTEPRRWTGRRSRPSRRARADWSAAARAAVAERRAAGRRAAAAGLRAAQPPAPTRPRGHVARRAAGQLGRDAARRTEPEQLEHRFPRRSCSPSTSSEFAHDPELDEAVDPLSPTATIARCEAGAARGAGAARHAHRPRRNLAGAVRPVPRDRPAGQVRDRRHRFRAAASAGRRRSGSRCPKLVAA